MVFEIFGEALCRLQHPTPTWYLGELGVGGFFLNFEGGKLRERVNLHREKMLSQLLNCVEVEGRRTRFSWGVKP